MLCCSYQPEKKKLVCLFLVLSLNALVSKIVFLVTFDNAHDACIQTYNVVPSDRGTCHPTQITLTCNGIETVSMTGRCADGSYGEDGGARWSSRTDPICREEDGETDGDFGYDGCVCCNFWQCEQSRDYILYDGAGFIGFDDPHLLKTYPQLDCRPTPKKISKWTGEVVERWNCTAWCSDGVWTNEESFANARKAVLVTSFVFAIIDLVVEAICGTIAFCYAIFGWFDPIVTSPISCFILFILNANNDKELSYTAKGRGLLIVHLIDDLVTGVLLTTFVSNLNKDNLWDNFGLLYAFASSWVEVLAFLWKIRVANAQLGGAPN